MLLNLLRLFKIVRLIVIEAYSEIVQFIRVDIKICGFVRIIRVIKGHGGGHPAFVAY